MAISNYSELKSAIADWLARSDLNSVIPTFISLTESELNRVLNAPEMESFATATTSENYVKLPGFVEMRRVSIEETHELQLITPEQLYYLHRSLPPKGKPQYAIVGSNSLEFWPKPDGEYTYSILYKAPIEPLSDEKPTNWVLQKHPDLYLYGSLTHSAPYLHHDERIAVWSTKYSNVLNQVNSLTERQQYPASSWRMRFKSVI